MLQGLPGLGLLPVRTEFGPAKLLHAGEVHFANPQGPWAALSGVAAAGYQIHCGQTQADPGTQVLLDAQGRAIGWQQGSVLGEYAHGLFDSPAVLRALFGAAVPTPEDAFETLADLAEAHLDASLLAQWLGECAA